MNILTLIQIASSILLVVLILLQQRGAGLSGGALGMGGGEGSYSSRRGVEKYIFRGTIVLAVVFLGSALLQLVL